MEKGLERDLGLYATITISIGAMIGSGIFVLPGLAAKIAGPAVILAYLLAGILVLPAALSKAEMATAMPEAGGTYLYIDRAMGPLPGTIAGIGAWFSLVFKSAFALVGLGAYLLLFVALPEGSLVYVSLGLAIGLVGVNLIGVKQSGRLQAIIVSIVLLALLAFIVDGLTFIDRANFRPGFFVKGPIGLLEATGFVFISYAGVTKIASVAEEVENPGRNIPMSILISVVLMMVVYTFTVFVIVGVVPIDTIENSLHPMADAAGAFLGPVGTIVISAVAVLALTSMANAGILSSSRFPLAMSRDDLAPRQLSQVSTRFRTPWYSILATGILLVFLIVFVPVRELAKLASAFKILVFAFVNVALIAFRESELVSYEPEFTAPGYPWVQLFGIFGGVVLISQLGPIPIAGAVGLILLGAIWYRVYGRERTEREGAALDAIRRGSAERALDRTRDTCAEDRPIEMLVPLGGTPSPDQRQEFLELIRLGQDIIRDRGGRIRVVRFEEVPEQLDLAAATDSPDDVRFELDSGELLGTDIPVEYAEVVTHDTKRSISNFVKHYDIDIVLGDWHPSRWHAELLGADVDWYMRHVAGDFVFVRNRGYDAVDELLVVADQGPFDPLEIIVADGIASSQGASIEFVSTLEPTATDEQVNSDRAYLESLSEFCTAESSVTVLRTADRIDSLREASNSADIVIIGTSAHHLVYDVVFGSLPDKLVERVDKTVLLAHSWKPRQTTFIRAILDRLVH